MKTGPRVVAVTAANSAVGQAILRHGDRDYRLRALVRSEHAARRLPPLPPEQGQVFQVPYGNREGLREALDGARAVIHLAGILVETRESSYTEANVETTRSVLDAARRSGVGKLVLVSALGAGTGSRNGYYRSKGQAEDLVRNSGLAYTILRVPLLLGRETEGAAALRRKLKRRLVWLVGGGRNPQQPLEVEDLARACLSATARLVARGMTLDLVGPVCLPEREILIRAARMLGRQVRIIGIPHPLIDAALRVRTAIQGPGLSPDVLEVVTGHRARDPLEGAGALGIELTGLDEMIRHSLGRMGTS